MKNKIKTKNITLVLILSLSLLLSGNLQAVSAQNLDQYSNYKVHISINPSHIEEGSKSHPIGYVYLLNRSNIPVTNPMTVDVMLTSDNPSIASVPEKITFPANAEYVQFDITTGKKGKTTITGSINNNLGFADINVGVNAEHLPDNLILELNLPTDKMHVNSEMPFSVFLRTIDETDDDIDDSTIVRVPYDIDVILDYEKSLAIPSNDTITIKAGEFYAWGTISSGQKVGNTFIRAIQPDTQLDTAKSITITSTLPASLNINIYPYLIPADIDRTLDIFVSVVDSNGDPTVASKDIPLKFFSNNQDYIGDELDDAMKELDMVIKKGEFGYHFRLGLDLIGLVSNDLFIGVSSTGLGTAIDKFQTVGESISVEDQRINTQGGLLKSDRIVNINDKKAVQLFGPLKVPSNSTVLFGYQLTIEENDDNDNPDDDPNFKEVNLDDIIEKDQSAEEKRRGGMNAQDRAGSGDVEPENTGTATGNTESSSDDDSDVLIYTIDNIEDGNLYPIQANENYRSTGLIQYLDVISEDDSLATVTDVGMIRPSYSYGVAEVVTTQKSGTVLLSANVKGIGSGSFLTEVVNSLEQKKIKIFSPTGENSLLINRDGSFDVFLVALDASDRPKILEDDKKYLVTPSNGIVDLERKSTFSTTTLQSESFTLEDGGAVVLKVTPIGEDADLDLESTSIFQTQLSSEVQILLPVENLDINTKEKFGIVQLVDLQGNPIEAFKDMRVKISSDNEFVAQTNQDAIIKKGSSYAEFPIETPGTLGSSILSASARGVVGSDVEVKTVTSSSALTIYTSGLVEPMPVNEEVLVKIIVDDVNGISIPGATVQITPNVNATANTESIRTGTDGSATFGLTAVNGPEIFVDFKASAPGFQDSKETIGIVVDTPPGGLTELKLPTELIYVIVGGMGVVAIAVVFFVKKSKEPIDDEEEPWEDDDI
ncbi:MAG: hypothetical protein OEL77_00510 [Nitrosopumilus sp.]|nr:hypothetical protein [Nitrosopumilus sp.]MDH3384484.1 hypothetical protein [Nitrosopumilus sp.]